MNTSPAVDRTVRAVATIGPLLFFGVATIEGLLRAGYDPLAQPISALAIGPRGWIQQLNFLVLAASFFSFAVVVRTRLRPGAAAVAAPAVLVLMTVGVLIAGAFTMDPIGAAHTLEGRLHGAAGFLVFPWMPVLALILARRFRRDPRWRPLSTYSLATGLFCLAMVIFFIAFVGPPDAGPRPLSWAVGLVQRILLLPFLMWVSLVARRASTVGASESNAAAGAPSLAVTSQ